MCRYMLWVGDVLFTSHTRTAKAASTLSLLAYSPTLGALKVSPASESCRRTTAFAWCIVRVHPVFAPSSRRQTPYRNSFTFLA